MIDETMPEAPGPIACLLVDDLDENLLVLSALLEPLQVEILTARSGADALDVLLSHDVALVAARRPHAGDGRLRARRDHARCRAHPAHSADLRDRRRRARPIGCSRATTSARSTSSTSRSTRTCCSSKARVFFELHRQKQLLAQQLRERTETLRLNETFAAMLGHDLRSPLDFILTASHLLDRIADDPEAVRRTARQMRTSGMRMGRMIADMLDLARGRLGGGIPIQPQPIDLAALVTARGGRVPGGAAADADRRRGRRRADLRRRSRAAGAGHLQPAGQRAAARRRRPARLGAARRHGAGAGGDRGGECRRDRARGAAPPVRGVRAWTRPLA